MSGPGRPVGLGLLVTYSALLLLAVLSPSNSEQSGMVLWLGRLLGHLGVPGSITGFGRLEVLTNAVIVAPVTFLATFVFPRLSWRDWTAWGFLASALVETFQLVVLPGRQGSYSDVVANTGGALLGALAMRVVHRVRLARAVPGFRRLRSCPRATGPEGSPRSPPKCPPSMPTPTSRRSTAPWPRAAWCR